MPTTFIYPNVGALWLAAQVQAALAASEVGLYQSGVGVVLTPTTTLADLEAVGTEADYTGYARETIAAFTAPLLSPLGGAAIQSGLLVFAIAAPYTVPNTLQGWFLVEPGGELLCAGDFATTKSFVGAGDGYPFNIELVFGI